MNLKFTHSHRHTHTEDICLGKIEINRNRTGHNLSLWTNELAFVVWRWRRKDTRPPSNTKHTRMCCTLCAAYSFVRPPPPPLPFFLYSFFYFPSFFLSLFLSSRVHITNGTEAASWSEPKPRDQAGPGLPGRRHGIKKTVATFSWRGEAPTAAYTDIIIKNYKNCKDQIELHNLVFFLVIY